MSFEGADWTRGLEKVATLEDPQNYLVVVSGGLQELIEWYLEKNQLLQHFSEIHANKFLYPHTPDGKQGWMKKDEMNWNTSKIKFQTSCMILIFHIDENQVDIQ